MFDRISNLYKGVAYWRGRYEVMQFPAFIFKRVAFISITVIWIKDKGCQIASYMLMQELYIILLVSMWPFEFR